MVTHSHPCPRQGKADPAPGSLQQHGPSSGTLSGWEHEQHATVSSLGESNRSWFAPPPPFLVQIRHDIETVNQPCLALLAKFPDEEAAGGQDRYAGFISPAVKMVDQQSLHTPSSDVSRTGGARFLPLYYAMVGQPDRQSLARIFDLFESKDLAPKELCESYIATIGSPDCPRTTRCGLRVIP
jgi:hypothetical protein